jgi:hypothetical protein
MTTHQATGGAQTPWQDTNPDTPAFALALSVDPQQAQGAAETLPNSTAPIGKLGADDAYLAAIWRNSIPDYEAYLDAFKTTAPNELLARVRALVETLKTPGPSCQAAVAPPPPRKIVAGPLCPEGFVPEDGYDGAYCAPIDPPPQLACPPGLTRVAGVDGFGCAPIEPRPTLDCPVGFRIYGDRDRLRRLGLSAYCEPEQPPPFVCPPGLHAAFHDGAQFCVHDGPPPPLCPPEMHPIWDGQGAYECFANPVGEPIVCQGGRPQWNFDHWICVNAPGRHADFCRPGEIEMWEAGRAVCAPPPPPPSVCPPGYFRVGGGCVAGALPGIAIGVGIGAAIGIGSHGGPPDAACPPGQPRVNGHCVIPPGAGVPRPPAGGNNGQTPQGSAPACPADQLVANGRCVAQPGPAPTPRPTPPSGNGQDHSGGAPACAAGQIAVSGHCVAQPGQPATPRPTPTLPAQPAPAMTPRPTPPAGNGQDHSGGPAACPSGQIAVNGHCVAQPGQGATPRPAPTLAAQPTPATTPRPTPPQVTPTPKAMPTMAPRPTPTPKAIPAAIPTPKPPPPAPPAPKPAPPPPPPPKPAPPPPPAAKPAPPPPPEPKPAPTAMPMRAAPPAPPPGAPGGHGRPGCPNPRDPACPPGR